MPSVTIPNTQYIGVNLHRSSDESMPLGFLTPGGTNAGAKKRIDTVQRWCGMNSSRHENIPTADKAQFEKDNPAAVWQRDNTHNPNYLNSVYTIPNFEDVDYKLYENVPNEPRIGFRITKMVSRSGSWNGGNKLVRIEDPRGFELEISVDNLVKVMSMTTFIDGVCQTECVWGRQGSNNILLPVNSDPYNEARATTDYRAKETISLRDVNFGDTVELKKTENFEGLTGEYMGAYHVYSLQSLFKSVAARGGEYDYNRKKEWTFMKSHKRYVIKKGDKYFGVSGCKIHKIIDKVDTPVERPDLSANNYQDLTYGQVGTIICLTTKKVPVNDIVKTAEFVPTVDIDPIHKQEHGSILIWTKDKDSGKMMRFRRAYYSPDFRHPENDESLEERLKLFEGDITSIDISNNTWQIDGTKGNQGKGPFHIIKNPTAKAALAVDAYDWYQLAFTVNGKMRKLPIKKTRDW